jgi:DNA invertase Pin-like site-specific DNA recombinase
MKLQDFGWSFDRHHVPYREARLGILTLIAEFENDIRRERQTDGIAKAKDRGVKFGRKLTDQKATEIRILRESGWPCRHHQADGLQ